MCEITAPILDEIQHAILKTDVRSLLVAMLKSQSFWMQLFDRRVLSELAKNGIWGPNSVSSTWIDKWLIALDSA